MPRREELTLPQQVLMLDYNPGYSLEHRAQVQPYKNPVDWGRVTQGLRAAGVLD